MNAMDWLSTLSSILGSLAAVVAIYQFFKEERLKKRPRNPSPAPDEIPE